MLSNVFLGFSLVGAEWVLYLLVVLSVLSVALIFERWQFYRDASKGSDEFRIQIRKAASSGEWEQALNASRTRVGEKITKAPDFEADLTSAIIDHHLQSKTNKTSSVESLSEVAQDSIVRTKLKWDKNLAILATIGNNAPFIGLFGTVLGIIHAFHELSDKSGAGVQGVTAGISEALIATAVGIFVAVPAVIAFNLFHRRVRTALAEAEALKSFLIGKMSQG